MCFNDVTSPALRGLPPHHLRDADRSCSQVPQAAPENLHSARPRSTTSEEGHPQESGKTLARPGRLHRRVTLGRGSCQTEALFHATDSAEDDFGASHGIFGSLQRHRERNSARGHSCEGRELPGLPHPAPSPLNVSHVLRGLHLRSFRNLVSCCAAHGISITGSGRMVYPSRSEDRQSRILADRVQGKRLTTRRQGSAESPPEGASHPGTPRCRRPPKRHASTWSCPPSSPANQRPRKDTRRVNVPNTHAFMGATCTGEPEQVAQASCQRESNRNDVPADGSSTRKPLS